MHIHSLAFSSGSGGNTPSPTVFDCRDVIEKGWAINVLCAGSAELDMRRDNPVPRGPGKWRGQPGQRDTQLGHPGPFEQSRSHDASGHMPSGQGARPGQRALPLSLGWQGRKEAAAAEPEGHMGPGSPTPSQQAPPGWGGAIWKDGGVQKAAGGKHLGAAGSGWVGGGCRSSRKHILP